MYESQPQSKEVEEYPEFFTKYHYEAAIDGLASVARRNSVKEKIVEEEKIDLKYKLDHDGLIPTMLNKMAAHELIDRRIEEQTPFGLFYIDLNSFKQVNDMLGHTRGDDLLKSLGQIMNEGFRRKTDELGFVLDQGRLGGDEFVVITDMSGGGRRDSHHAQMDNVYELLKEIEIRFQNENPDAFRLGAGLAIGSAYFSPNIPVDSETLLAQAEEAMREEKGARAR